MRFASGEHTTDHIAVAVQVLGTAVRDQIDTELDRVLEERAVVAVVAERDDPLLLGDTGHGSKILKFEGE